MQLDFPGCHVALPKEWQRPEVEHEPQVLGTLSRARAQVAAVQLEAVLRSRCIGISRPLPRDVRIVHATMLALHAEQRPEQRACSNVVVVRWADVE